MRRLRNTSGLPDELVRRVTDDIAKTLGIGGFDIECRNCSGTLAGAAYTHGSSYHATARPFVVLRIGTEVVKPHYFVQEGERKLCGSRSLLLRRYGRVQKSKIKLRFPATITPYQRGQHRGKRYVIANRVEALVYIAAHELRHLWQERRWMNKRGCKPLPYAHGAAGKFSEIDTEAFAIHTLRQFRKNSA